MRSCCFNKNNQIRINDEFSLSGMRIADFLLMHFTDFQRLLLFGSIQRTSVIHDGSRIVAQTQTRHGGIWLLLFLHGPDIWYSGEKNHFQAGFSILALRSRKITMVVSGMQ